MNKKYIPGFMLLFFVQSLFTLAENKGVDRDPQIKGNQIKRFVADSLSIVKNPCTGWAVYCDNFIPEDPVDYYEQLEACGALDYATHMYVRAGWAKYEPQEGVYAWNTEGPFRTLIEETQRRGLKLAFRVYYDNRDYDYQVTPLYVKEAGAEGYSSNTGFWSPYVDDPVFKTKLEKFIMEFGKEFNDPAVVDYVDGFGLGIWGEGFGATYKDPSNKDNVLYWLTETFANAFTRVMLVINAHEDIGGGQIEEVLEKCDYIARHDAYGSVNHRYFGAMEQDIIRKNFPRRFVVAESMYWLSAGPDTNFPIRDGYKDWRETLESTFRDVKALRANTFDLRNVLECKLLWMKIGKDIVDEFARKGGYRLAPVEISFPERIKRNATFTLRHKWTNLGWGVCPNNNSRWNYKYKTAFSLLSPKDYSVVETLVDEQGDPSQWLLNEDKSYTFQTRSSAPPGEYLLAVAIIDKTNGNIPGINLAVADTSDFQNDWLIIHKVKIK